MGYTSDIRSLIYGDPDAVGAFVARHKLEGHLAFTAFAENIRIYDRLCHYYYHGIGRLQSAARITIIDLKLDCVKWYSDSDNVCAWERLIRDADAVGLNYEFLRLGEESTDMNREFGGPDVQGWLAYHVEIVSHVDTHTMECPNDTTDDTSTEI